MNRIECFFVEPTGRARIDLRRYYSRSLRGDINDKVCSGKYGYHNASITVDERPITKTSDGYISCISRKEFLESQWPTKCDYCDYVFEPEDEWQVNQHEIYRATDGRGEWILRELSPGAMWYADWGLKFGHSGPDGRCLYVMTPEGEWCIDGRANNCTRPEDKEHRCWVRHGVPPLITVDKNGNTCAAGGGSILIRSYHGFLRNGYLEEC